MAARRRAPDRPEGEEPGPPGGIIDSERITRPNILKGGEAIAERHHVEGYPSRNVIDARGVIRAKRFNVADPHSLLDPLVKEAEAATES
jgi:hypothetical protein